MANQVRLRHGRRGSGSSTPRLLLARAGIALLAATLFSATSVTRSSADLPPHFNGILFLSAATGEVQGRIPGEAVWVAIPDGRRGWFVGGEVKELGGVPRRGLARIRANRTVDRSWRADVAGGRNDGLAVAALLLHRERLLVGGSFRWIRGRARRNLAAVDPRTGVVLPWRPTIRGLRVNGLAATKDTVVVATDVESVAFDARSGMRLWRRPFNSLAVSIADEIAYLSDPEGSTGIVAVNARTGRRISWRPRDRRPYEDVVRLLLASARSLFWSGDDYSGRFDRQTGRRVAPVIAGGLGLKALAQSSQTVYVGADAPRFSPGLSWSVGGERRNGLAAINDRTGAVTPWAPNVAPYTLPNALAANATTVLVAGLFADSLG